MEIVNAFSWEALAFLLDGWFWIRQLKISHFMILLLVLFLLLKCTSSCNDGCWAKQSCLCVSPLITQSCLHVLFCKFMSYPTATQSVWKHASIEARVNQLKSISTIFPEIFFCPMSVSWAWSTIFFVKNGAG